jgi:hypothetical protein
MFGSLDPVYLLYACTSHLAGGLDHELVISVNSSYNFLPHLVLVLDLHYVLQNQRRLPVDHNIVFVYQRSILNFKTLKLWNNT